MLLDLPEEVTLCICSFLNAKDLCSLSCVCRQLEVFTSDPVLWRELFETSSDKLITMVPPSDYIPLPSDNTNNNNNNSNNEQFTLNSNYIKDNEEDFRFWKYLCLKSKKYDRITAAVGAAKPGSHIHLRPSVYVENFIIDKPVHIIGIGDSSTVVLENEPGVGVVITVDVIRAEAATSTKPPLPADSSSDPSNTTMSSSTPSSSLPALQSGALSPVSAMSSIRGCTLRQKPTTPRRFCVEVLCGSMLIENCTVISESLSCICVQRDGKAVVRRNKISGTSAGVSVFECTSDTIIEDNQFYSKYSGIEIMRFANPIVRRNNICGEGAVGIFIVDNAISRIENNNICNASSGIQVSRGANPVVVRNKIHHGQGGIALFEKSTGTFEENEIYDNSENNIFVGSQCNPIFSNNKSFRSKWNGIYVGEGGAGTFESNEIYENEEGGILAKDESNAKFVNNVVRDNNSLGVMVYGTGHFERNRIVRNEGGIEVGRTGKPTLIENTFEDNESVGVDTKACIERGECTFSISSTSFVPQYWWFCDTCEEGGNKGCCAACAKVCHKGHKLSQRRFSSFYCDCGAEWRCRLMPNRKDFD